MRDQLRRGVDVEVEAEHPDPDRDHLDAVRTGDQDAVVIADGLDDAHGGGHFDSMEVPEELAGAVRGFYA